VKWLGFREIPVAQIMTVATDEIERRRQEPHVAELARSFVEATGGEPGAALWVTPAAWPKSYLLVAGRDRLAACLLNNLQAVWVRVGEFTSRELVLAEVHENLRRRHDSRDALIARLVDETQAELTQAAIVPQAGEVLRGAPTTTRSAARAEVAAATGLTPKAVARADERAHAPAKDSRLDPSTPAIPPSAGNQREGEKGAGVLGAPDALAPREPHAALMSVERHIRDAQADLAPLLIADVRGVPGLLSRLNDALDACRVAMSPPTERRPSPAAPRLIVAAAQTHARKTGVKVIMVTPDGDVPFEDIPDPTDLDAPAEESF